MYIYIYIYTHIYVNIYIYIANASEASVGSELSGLSAAAKGCAWNAQGHGLV